MDFDRAERIGRLVEKEFSRDMGKYEEGKCPEFAIALQQAVPGSHLEVCTRSWIDWGGVTKNKLSHVVVTAGVFDFDAGGGEAQARWESRWDGDYSDEPDEGVEFSWDRISTAALAKRVRECRENDPELDWKLVEKLSQRMTKIGKEASRAKTTIPRPKNSPDAGKKKKTIGGR